MFHGINLGDAMLMTLKAGQPMRAEAMVQAGYVQLDCEQSLVKAGSRWTLRCEHPDPLMAGRYMPHHLQHLLIEEAGVELDRDEFGHEIWPWEIVVGAKSF
ncbi:MAG: hypothetical protein Q8P59_06885 [Dehalococcoidia bacterium]|nr:hypothetical protein [Dehalococcoidia bacterium]